MSPAASPRGALGAAFGLPMASQGLAAAGPPGSGCQRSASTSIVPPAATLALHERASYVVAARRSVAAVSCTARRLTPSKAAASA